MIDKLKILLEYEQEQLETLVELAKKQQQALISYNIKDLEMISNRQNEISKNLRQVEEQRITLMAVWLKKSRKEVLAIKLSSLEQNLPENERHFIVGFSQQFAGQLNKLTSLNVLNRLLANRAGNSIRQMLLFLTNGTNHVCNVKV